MSEENKRDKLTQLRIEITRMQEVIVHYKEKLKQLAEQEVALKQQVADLKEENKKLQQQQTKIIRVPSRSSEEENDTIHLLNMEQCERWWLHLSHRIEELYVRLDRQNEKINRLIGGDKMISRRQRQRSPNSPNNQSSPKTLQPPEPADRNKRLTIKLTPAPIELTDWQKKNIEMGIKQHARKREQGKEQPKGEDKKKENLIVGQETPSTEKAMDEMDLPVSVPSTKDSNTFYKWFVSRFGES